MKQTVSKIGKVIATLSATALALPVMAQGYNPPIDIVGGGVQIGTLISQIITWIATIVGGIAVLFIIYGGIIYITGGEKGAEKGKAIVLNAVVGLAIIILAVVIVTAINRALSGG